MPISPLQATIARHNLQEPLDLTYGKTYILPPTIIDKSIATDEAEKTVMRGRGGFESSRTIIVNTPPTIIEDLSVNFKGVPAAIDKNTALSGTILNDLIHHKTSALLAHLKPQYFVLKEGANYQNYTIVNKIGEGAHAKIYKANNRFRSRPCALKVLNFYEMTALTKADIFRNFRFEYQVGQIDSEYLIQSYEQGFIHGNPLIISEYADGGDLNSLMNDQLSLDIINKIALDILRGLSALHEKGLIHRDLKPHNIFLNRQTFKIGDFGVSAFADQASAKKESLQAYNRVGTYGYMAPELFSDQPSSISQKNDLFSFGCLMFQVITGGVLPFGQIKNESDIENYIYNSKNAVFRSLRSYRRDMPTYWEDILFECLQPDPNDRSQSADALIETLLNSAARPEQGAISTGLQQKYLYDLYFSFAEADKLLAIEIFSFLDNKGVKVCMSNHLFDLQASEKEEHPPYQQSRHFLVLYTKEYQAYTEAQEELQAFTQNRKENHQKIILYDAVIGETPNLGLPDDGLIVQSKKDILNTMGIGELFDRRHPKPQSEVVDTIQVNAREMKGKILNLIAQNHLKKAIGLFFKHLSETDPNDDAIGSLSVLSSRYKSLEQDKAQGTIHFEALKVEENKLILGLNKLVLDFFK